MTGFDCFVSVCRRIESISGSIEITGVVSDLLRSVDDDELAIVARFIMGEVFPRWTGLELGVGPNLLYMAIAKAAGIKVSQVKDLVRDLGDVGEAARAALVNKTEVSFSSFFGGKSSISIGEVYSRFLEIARFSGKGSQSAKVRTLQYLFSSVSPDEAVYISRLALEELRIGVGEGIVRDAIAEAFGVDKELVERGYMLTNDLGMVACTAKRGGEAGLRGLGIQVGRPVKMMLAQVVESSEAAVSALGCVAVEWKFDGARIQVHKDGDRVILYSRRLENVTDSLPDIVGRVRSRVVAREAILDGEVVAIGEDGKPMAFQQLLRRFRRKHGVEGILGKIPLTLNLFDIMYMDGRSLIDLPLRERRRFLTGAVREGEGLLLAKETITSDPHVIDSVYADALEAGHEGVMLKNPLSVYTPGKRGRNWLKLKPIMENLDLVVVGGEWGKGRRAHLIGSYVLACIDPESRELLQIGRVGTGMSDEDLKDLTEVFRELIVSEEGRDLSFEPKIIFEVAYEEIQKSSNYSSGYALRFPRLVRVRYDKSLDDADTIDRVESLYLRQRR